jgi:hypothetical protein
MGWGVIMILEKFRKVKKLELTDWKSVSDMWGEPTVMFHELLKDLLLQIGDKILIDLRMLVERKEKCEHEWEWKKDLNNQRFGICCKCKIVNDDFRSPEIAI